jgi:hypothetical protein
MGKTTYKDIGTAERREHERTDGYSVASGRSHCYITCPFCGESVKAYLWSLAGGGKRCTCGALHDNYGHTHKKAE